MKLLHSLDGFFFRRIPATGFSLMRIAWAFVTMSFLLMQWKDTTDYYSDSGLLPHDLMHIFMRTNYHFTVLDWVTQPNAVFSLYLVLLLILFCMMIGLWPRVMTIASVVLLYSFHERNTMLLGGGDTLLRTIGFLLMLSPGIHGFSVSRLGKQWAHWRKNRSLLPSPTMPIWPWRLLLWQMVFLYLTSLWYKLLGTMWLDGTAIEAVFHHPVFTRWPREFMYLLLPGAWLADYLTLVWHAMWGLLLIPKVFTRFAFGTYAKIPLKRCLIIGGIFFHGGILVFMDAGVFSLAVFTAYIGLLREEDFSWLKRVMLKRSSTITVLFDGHCGLCLRSIFALQLVDHLKKLKYVNFRDADERKKHAPNLSLEDLDRSMHIIVPPTSYNLKPKTYRGFDAFRNMAWSLPTLWLPAPFLYIPGIPFIGRRIYARIAVGRKKCDHESCVI